MRRWLVVRKDEKRQEAVAQDLPRQQEGGQDLLGQQERTGGPGGTLF